MNSSSSSIVRLFSGRLFIACGLLLEVPNSCVAATLAGALLNGWLIASLDSEIVAWPLIGWLFIA